MVLVVNILRGVYKQGQYNKVKTRLTTRREEEYKGGRDIIHSVV